MIKNGTNNSLYKLFTVLLLSIPINFTHLSNNTIIRKLLGEFSGAGYFYVAICAFLFIFFNLGKLHQYKLKIPQIYIIFLVMFYIAIFISTILNFNDILNSELKGRSGVEKWFVQLCVSIFVFLFIIIVYNILLYLKNSIGLELLLKNIFRIFDVVIISSIVFCFFEYLNIYYFNFSMPIFSKIVNIFHEPEYARIRFVTDEASKYGSTFIALFFPRILSKIRNNPKNLSSWFIFFSILFFTLHTNSRASYMLIVIYIISFIYLVIIKKLTLKKIIITCGILFISVLLIFIFISVNPESPISNKIAYTYSSIFNFTKESNAVGSNLTRYGMTFCAINMGIDNPFGVGLGQFGFNFEKHFDMQYYHEETAMYFPNAENTHYSWPIPHSVYASSFSELGFLGLFAWLLLLSYLLFNLLNVYRFNAHNNTNDCKIDMLQISILYMVSIILYFIHAPMFSEPSVWFVLSFVFFTLNLCGQSKRDTINVSGTKKNFKFV